MHQEFTPPEELRDSIRCFWYNSREYGTDGTHFEVQPDGYAEIIFYFGSGGCSIADNGVLQPLPSPFLMGLLNEPAVFYTKDRLQIIGIRCFPWTVFDLLGLPSDKYGVRVFEHPIAGLQTNLNKYIEAGAVEEAVAAVNAFFLDGRLQTADPTLSKAGAAMSGAKGVIAVSKVAAAAHATVRTLERKFKKSSGHSVKDVSGLMRFEQVRNHLWLHPDTNLAGLAMELGYTDQSHLSREFKRYSGATPAAFARKAKVQGVSKDIVAFVQS